ncbi:MAG TPA: TetR/AcrR family transcriptional regulator [Rhodocyclaceae bacterium]|nr:TetR/AcrR family transcriptional regulator [Rhodocyclaceae bacterium]HMV52252.1 TetR/AcrR family transcriptional regulator [Rhodocyclaceae bacterium]HMZ83450.1 TetR/AcrR family transcriptional regulator [Rhodocyclaceae bacterium]HNA05112.1 TetR/AcrR family transcriptional regulator [Rhodocyclaceae bacterium]HNB77259.1 TetR/AcrR family transcriptional regulator [Rhodocyclaceae bacterium]
MPPPSAAPRNALDRQAWIDAATTTLAEYGVAGVRVEALAKTLGVTKGSFYWHFRDRQALLEAVLDNWKQGRIGDIVKQTRCEPGHEREQLDHVMAVYSASRNRKGIRIELAIRDWARRDPTAATVVEEVDATRYDCARTLFVARGMSAHEAATRSVLLYAYVFGQSLMDCDRIEADMPRVRSEIFALING